MDCLKWSSFAFSSHLCWPFWLPLQCIPSQPLPLPLSRWAPLSPLKLFLATPCSLSSPKAWQPKIILLAAPPTTLQDPKSYIKRWTQSHDTYQITGSSSWEKKLTLKQNEFLIFLLAHMKLYRCVHTRAEIRVYFLLCQQAKSVWATSTDNK